MVHLSKPLSERTTIQKNVSLSNQHIPLVSISNNRFQVVFPEKYLLGHSKSKSVSRTFDSRIFQNINSKTFQNNNPGAAFRIYS